MIGSFITSITLTFIITYAIASLILSSGMVWNVVAMTAGNVNVSVEGWIDGVANKEELTCNYSSDINAHTSLDWQIGDMVFQNGRKPISISLKFQNLNENTLSISLIKPQMNTNLINKFFVNGEESTWDEEFNLDADEEMSFSVEFHVIDTTKAINRADVGFSIFLDEV